MKIKTFIFISSFLFLQNSYAAPTIKLCIDGNCKTSVRLVIHDDKWATIKDVFIEPAKTAYDERKLILKSLPLIEKISLNILAERSVKKYSAEDLHDRMSNKDQALNYKAYISLLLDQNLIRHHFLRKTERRSSWSGMKEYIVVIQDHRSGELYALDANKTDFGETPEMQYLKSWKNEKTVKKLKNKAIDIIGNSKTQFKNHVE